MKHLNGRSYVASFHRKHGALQPAANEADPLSLWCKSVTPPRDHDTSNNQQQVREQDGLGGPWQGPFWLFSSTGGVRQVGPFIGVIKFPQAFEV